MLAKYLKECGELIKHLYSCVCHFVYVPVQFADVAFGSEIIYSAFCFGYRCHVLWKKPESSIQEVQILKNNGDHLPYTGMESAV